MGRLRITGAIGVFLAAAPHLALAQTSPLIIDQSRADRRAPDAPTTSARSSAGVVQQQAVSITPFVLKGVQFDGARGLALPVREATEAFIGQPMDSARLNVLADAVSAAIGKTDVALYTVVLPNQTFKNGVVHLQIIEGYVADVQVSGQGAARRDIARAKALATPLMRERPLHRTSLERSLSLVRDMPGIQADIKVLRASAPGAVRLAIDLKKKVFTVAVGVNDRGTAELGRTQVDLELKMNGLLRSGDQTLVTIAFPTDIQRFQYYSLSQSEPIGDQGLTATANAGYLVTRPASIDIHGSAVTAGLQISYPVVRRYMENLYITGSFDGVNSSNALFGQSISDERTRALRVAAAYTKSWPKTTLSGSLTGSFGLNVLGARVLNPGVSDENFRKVNMHGALDHQLSPQWIVRLRAEAQYSGDHLPATEQLALGGQEFGRAFESALIIGDYGAAGSAELAWRPRVVQAKLKGAEVFGFLDGGQLRRTYRVDLPGQTYSLASAGFGTRVPVFDKTNMEIEADHALTTPYGERESEWRVVFGFRSVV